MTAAKAVPSRRDSLARRGLVVLAHPRSGGALIEYVATFCGCLAVLGLVLVGEYYLENNPTLQGFALLSILVATWRLPARLSALIAGLAAALPFVSVDLGSLDTLTARFQLISTVVTACLAEFTVRAILQADRERSALLDVLVRFTADAAHELRSPITAIQTVAEVALAQPRSHDEYRRSIETVLRSSRKLIRLTDALLLLASEDAGALTVAGDPVDLSDLVEEALDRWRKRSADRGVRLDGPTATVGGLVSGDEVLLGRLLDNLMENAIRHAGSGGRVSVELGGSMAGGWTIVVSDTGPGLRPGVPRPRVRAVHTGGQAPLARRRRRRAGPAAVRRDRLRARGVGEY